jgi:hypothetical protein
LFGNGFHTGQGTGDAQVHVLGRGLAGFKVFFCQHVQADGLHPGQGEGEVIGVGFHERFF